MILLLSFPLCAFVYVEAGEGYVGECILVFFTKL